MKLTNLFNLILMGVALIFSAVGCRKNPGIITPIPGLTHDNSNTGPLSPQNPINNQQPIDTTGSTGNTSTGIPLGPGHTGWREDNDSLKAQTVYFEYDKSSIRTSEQSKLNDVASYLKSHRQAAVRVEGNCDERGTEEYNRSLGERRALAAREYLVRLGIDPNNVDTISYGQDHPVEPLHSEAAWSKNRRDDFVVLTPPSPTP